MGQLRSLKINHCYGLENLLKPELVTNPTFVLINLELMLGPSDSSSLRAFLESFVGLRHLKLMICTSSSWIDSSLGVSGHGATLRSFLYHERAQDEHNQGIWHDKSLTSRRPLGPGNSVDWEFLSTFLFKFGHLDCLAICEIPVNVKEMISTGSLPQCLRLLHLRMTAGNSRPSWWDGTWQDLCNNTNEANSRCNKYASTSLSLAKKAFSGDGLQNLQILAMGDFSYNNRFKGSNILLCRDSSSSILGFRTMGSSEIVPFRGLQQALDFLGACPGQRLFEDGIDGDPWPDEL